MTQPDYVPLSAPDRVRPSDVLSQPERWEADRPGELTDLSQPAGAHLGSTGPDMGYGLKLAKRFEDRLVIQPGEDHHDAVAGCFACGAKRAASFGRAPVIYDMDWAYTLWGYLGSAHPDLVTWRSWLFRGVSHYYWDQRGVVDSVVPSAFRLTPAQVGEQVAGDGWGSLFARA